jgi:hypothetical protein
MYTHTQSVLEADTRAEYTTAFRTTHTYRSLVHGEVLEHLGQRAEQLQHRALERGAVLLHTQRQRKKDREKEGGEHVSQTNLTKPSIHHSLPHFDTHYTLPHFHTTANFLK